ncbi:aldehyde dehydrogenase family protein [Paraburkholderia phenoliruptrix]|uniref:aldehyde dehydrogenase family protein n=1 Tax=Paraburkholderia phenoliruptrix TaxID=252970 RepID=UPI0028698B3F|nr:aldehyde dehydrogenase family protein [Paraburkholderia phenoliruptrix]WMY11019.1 aldehyde dehydrogenase family protein [Paraburkholderia phenoliruptrix]
MAQYRIFIDGSWREGALGRKPVVSPSTEQAVATVPVAGPRDLDDAIRAAVRARSEWAGMDAYRRADILRRAAAIIEGKIPDSARRMVKEQGKTLSEAKGELTRAAETFIWAAEHANELCKPFNLDGRRTLQYSPIGVVAGFTPWNYPAVLTARKVAPALAAGCTFILKAAEEAPAAAVAIVEALQDAGLPDGVIALVFGEPPMISTHLLNSPEIRMVSFTGSTRVGKEIAALAAKNLQSCALELGGHSPVLVFEDSDIEGAARAICEYKFEYAGQSCNAPSRIFVHRSRYEELIRELVKFAKNIRVGDAEDPDVDMGPMIGARGLARMKRLLEDAIGKGALLQLGGQALDRKGYFWPPTVVSDVPSSALVMSEEPFGPILPVAPFDTLEEAIKLANSTAYGLASYVFSSSPQTRNTVAKRLEFGSVSINMLKGVSPDVPNPGIKDSGLGHEGGVEGFRAFQNVKLINNIEN